MVRRREAARTQGTQRRRFPKMAAATSGEICCGEAPAGGKRGHLGIPEAVFVVRAAPGPLGGAAGGAEPAAP